MSFHHGGLTHSIRVEEWEPLLINTWIIKWSATLPSTSFDQKE